MSDDIKGSNWSDDEVDLIVADYFEMLRSELAGTPYVKAHRNRALQTLTGPSHTSIEKKHQNISAVLVRLGLPWIIGYKPLANFQNALIDGIGRYLGRSPEPLSQSFPSPAQAVADPRTLWIGPPPVPSVEDKIRTPALSRLVSKYDPAERDARNRALGKEGERLVFEYERHRLTAAGREDLSRRIEWTSEERGDGAGYDILSFHADGRERLIEVKTTNGAAITPFFLSENERAFSEERPEAFRLLRVYSFAARPAAFELAPPLQEHLTLSATNYRATF